MLIRAEQPGDETAIDRVHAAAFGDHSREVCALVGSLRLRLRDDELSLVAMDDDVVVGHVMFTTCLLDAPRKLVEVQVLSPVGVLPDRQRQGIGTALIRHGLAALADRGVPLVFLEGDPGYYSRLGFVEANDFRKPSLRIPDRAFQVMRLSAYEPSMTGTLVYSEPFWTHDCVGLRDSADAL